MFSTAREPLDHGKRKIGSLKLRIGVEHDGAGDGVRDRLEIGLDARVRDRKIGFEDREHAVDAERDECLRKLDRAGRRGRGDAGDDGHASARRAHHAIDDLDPLLGVEIGEFAGRAERREAMHAGLDQMLDERGEHIRLDASFRIDGRDEIGEDAFELGGGHGSLH